MDHSDLTMQRIVLKSDTEVFATNAVTPAGGIDLRGVIQSKLEADEQLVWHGHASSGGAIRGMAFRIVGALSMLYLASMAVRPIFDTLNQQHFYWFDRVVLGFVAISQVALACWVLINGWRHLVDNRYTLYAISNKRAFKVRPSRSLWTDFGVPDNWEMRMYSPHPSPGDGTEYGQIYKAHARRVGQEFLAEFKSLPGAADALDGLNSTNPSAGEGGDS
jgi:hypothetical protein